MKNIKFVGLKQILTRLSLDNEKLLLEKGGNESLFENLFENLIKIYLFVYQYLSCILSKPQIMSYDKDNYLIHSLWLSLFFIQKTCVSETQVTLSGKKINAKKICVKLLQEKI